MVESDDQLVHVSRYIHLNPVVAGLVDTADMIQYPYSSLGQYVQQKPTGTLVVNSGEVLGRFEDGQDYASFVRDQADYAQSLHQHQKALFEN